MNAKNERVTIRLSADDAAQLRAIAEANDEPVAQVIRRAVRAFLAVAAVLVAVLTLSACSDGDAPAAPSRTTVTLDEAREIVRAEHSAELEAEATALAKGCTQTGPGSEFDQRWNSYPSPLTATDAERAAAGDAMRAWIDDQPDGCTEADVALIREVRAGAVILSELDD